MAIIRATQEQLPVAVPRGPVGRSRGVAETTHAVRVTAGSGNPLKATS